MDDTTETSALSEEGRPCGVDLASRPAWMSEWQYNPCRCVRALGHDGDHLCVCDLKEATE